MISTNQFKNGAHIEVDGQIYRIMDFQHVKPGKGGAFVRTKLRRASDGGVVDKTFRAGEKFRPVRTETRKMQFLYDSGEMAVFMDAQSYEQTEIPGESAGEDMKWVRPNDTVEILYVDEKPTGVQVAERGRSGRLEDRPWAQGRHRIGRWLEAGDARDRRRDPGAALHRRGRGRPRRHPLRRIRFARLDGASSPRTLERCAAPTNARKPCSRCTSAT